MMNTNKSGLVFGSLMALFHLVWGILVAFGWAQALLDFVYNLHSLNNPFFVIPFDLMRTVGLIIFTFIVGYIFGCLMSLLWNKIHK